MTRELKTLAQQYTERAVEVLAAIMGDDGAPRAARVTAAIALLDRGHGKPMQQVEATGQDGAPLIPVAPGKIALAILNVLRAADTNGE